MSRWRNVRRGSPCAICDRTTWCSYSDDGQWALCRRLDAGGEHRVDRAGMEYWLHRLDGARSGPPPPLPEPTTERAAAPDLDRVYGALLRALHLSAHHRESLRGRGLEDRAIEEGMYRTLPARGRAALAREMVERFPERLLLAVPGFRVAEGFRLADRAAYLTVGGPAGLVVPVLDAEHRVVALKVRRDEAHAEAKYVYLSSTGAGGPGPGAPIHVPRWAEAGDQVRVTEGELKADVATRLSGVPTISVPGVSGWRAVIPVLRTLGARRVLLAFDADASTNEAVARASEATAAALAADGHEVFVETWDPVQGKGIDDALAARAEIVATAAADGRLAAPPTVAQPSRSPRPSAYRATEDGFVWERVTADGPVRIRLTNFTATIATEIVEDDGVDTRRRFEVEARLNGCSRRFTVPADSFASMSWVAEHLGARAIIFPGFGLRDHARAAVQVLSTAVSERRVFSHTGWRELPSGWAWLHAGGAIGACGSVPGVEVALPSPLAGFSLPEPPEGDELAEALRASLRLLEVGPDAVTVPLLAAAYRAAMPGVDFGLHLAGPSGAGKSELASLVQRHYGAGMDARHLPGSWSSTGNALELLASAAKDALLVVDDFAPVGALADVQRAHREADRLLRAQGNGAGRLRMHSEGGLRPVRFPRGLILSTGEDVPRGQSLRARLLVTELGPDDVDWTRLTSSQKDASEGLYGRALAGFLQWAASRYVSVTDALRRRAAQLGREACSSAAHRRTPEIVGNLAAGLELVLQVARSAGVVSDEEETRLWSRMWSALGEAAWAQARHQTRASPADRFVELLAAALACGRAHLAAPDGCQPEPPGAWGWRNEGHLGWEPRGERIGWIDGQEIYLEPTAAHAVAERLAHEVGEPLALNPYTLRRRIKERGLLATTDRNRESLTVRRVLEGHRREVLHLKVMSLSGASEPEREREEVER